MQRRSTRQDEAAWQRGAAAAMGGEAREQGSGGAISSFYVGLFGLVERL